MHGRVGVCMNVRMCAASHASVHAGMHMCVQVHVYVRVHVRGIVVDMAQSGQTCLAAAAAFH